MGSDVTFPGRRGIAPARGFTIIELLITVAVVGILAVLAIVVVRKYIHAAYTGEPKAMFAGIRAAQSVYLSEHQVYANCSATLDSHYPDDPPDDKKRSFSNPSHGEYACWNGLNIRSDGPVRYVYSVVAGVGTASMPTIPNIPSQPTWPPGPGGVRGPWFVLHAAGDIDNDSVLSSFWASSFDTDVRSHKEDE